MGSGYKDQTCIYRVVLAEESHVALELEVHQKRVEEAVEEEEEEEEVVVVVVVDENKDGDGDGNCEKQEEDVIENPGVNTPRRSKLGRTVFS